MDIGKAQTSLNLFLVLGILGLIAWAVYKLFGPGGTLGKDNPDNVDPASGEYIGPANAIDNAVVPEKFPGGGEVAGSSETYTGAATTTITHPLGSLAAIIGWDSLSAGTGGAN
jgi:hypothetical protein